MNELDSDAHLLLLENHIDQVETRLGMLRDQIVAMSREGEGIGPQNELLFSTQRAMCSLKLLLREIQDDAGQPSAQGRAF